MQIGVDLMSSQMVVGSAKRTPRGREFGADAYSAGFRRERFVKASTSEDAACPAGDGERARGSFVASSFAR